MAESPLADRPARLFWAVGLDDAAAGYAHAECDRLAAHLPAGAAPRVRWQPRDNWHLTLFFLGNTQLAQGLAMADALQAPLSALDPFSVPLAPGTWFPSREHPLVIALPATSTAPLLALSSLVSDVAVACGAPHEPRPFRGHVSLARVRRGYRPRDPLPADGAAGAGAQLRIDHLALYESLSTGDGARYQAMMTLPLRAASR